MPFKEAGMGEKMSEGTPAIIQSSYEYGYGEGSKCLNIPINFNACKQCATSWLLNKALFDAHLSLIWDLVHVINLVKTVSILEWCLSSEHTQSQCHRSPPLKFIFMLPNLLSYWYYGAKERTASPTRKWALEGVQPFIIEFSIQGQLPLIYFFNVGMDKSWRKHSRNYSKVTSWEETTRFSLGLLVTKQ